MSESSMSHPNTAPLRVFLCHSSADKPAVRELYRRLKADGILPWLDEEDLLPGQDWRDEIPAAVKRCDIVVVCLSKSSVTKAGYVQKEIRYALDVADEQPENTIYLIPLKLEECEIPYRLSRWQWVNYFERDGYDKLMRSLALRQRGMLPPGPEPVSPHDSPPKARPETSARPSLTTPPAIRQVLLMLMGLVLLAGLIYGAKIFIDRQHGSPAEPIKNPDGPHKQLPKPDEIPKSQAVGNGGIVFELADSFIDRYKDRATINPKMIVDMTGKLHSPNTDGDLHVSGRAEEVLLPVVAEVMNAKEKPDVVQKFQAAAASHATLWISGAWRLWPEQSTIEQTQGAALQGMIGTNPPHIFEVHPVTRVEDVWINDTLKPITGYEPKDAGVAFGKYEKAICTLAHDAQQQTTTVKTKIIGYNYVEFVMKLTGSPAQLEDGHAVEASIWSTKNEELVSPVRAISIKDTAPDSAIAAAKAGQSLHVLGIPRLNLNALSVATKAATVQSPVKLPYEMIIVGIYP